MRTLIQFEHYGENAGNEKVHPAFPIWFLAGGDHSYLNGVMMNTVADTDEEKALQEKAAALIYDPDGSYSQRQLNFSNAIATLRSTQNIVIAQIAFVP